MNKGRLELIAEAFGEFDLATGGALLRLKMLIGRQMWEAVAAKECRSVKAAVGYVASYVTRIRGREYGQKWWHTCYLYHANLVEGQRRLVIEKNVPVRVVDQAVNSRPAKRAAILEEGCCDRKRVLAHRVKIAEREPARPGSAGWESRKEDPPIVLTRPFDGEKVGNMLAAILGDIRTGRAPLTLAEFDGIVAEAKRMAGVKT